jgi:hypothetical protein
MAAAPHIPPLFALYAWVPIGLLLFYRYPVRVAILITLIGGWAVLPTANFAPTDAEFPYWIMSASLPAGYFLTKATITGMTALAGVLVFDWRGLRRIRPSLWDLPVALWCVVPLLSGMANHGAYEGALHEGVRGAVYQLLAWGVPYLLGRLYFTEGGSLELAAKAFAIAGLCYVPICLVEVVTGPQFYAHVYGYQPYRWLGAERYLGFRPVGFLEDGNQLGIWMAVATLLAIGLWKYSRERRLLRFPIGWAALTLLVVTILCQSGGSIILMLCLLPFVLVNRATFRRRVAIALALIVLCFAGLRLSNVVSLRWMVDNTRPARAVEMFLYRIGRQSFGWRLAQDERHVRTTLERPIAGWGRWDWWRNGEERPWGLWLLAYGMYGGVGLAALEALQLLPVVRTAWIPERRGLRSAEIAMENAVKPDVRVVCAAVLLLAAIDNLLNSGMILPLVLLIGGMSAGSAMNAGKRNSDKLASDADATIGG